VVNLTLFIDSDTLNQSKGVVREYSGGGVEFIASIEMETKDSSANVSVNFHDLRMFKSITEAMGIRVTAGNLPNSPCLSSDELDALIAKFQPETQRKSPQITQAAA
jgi:hypothetical protein